MEAPSPAANPYLRSQIASASPIQLIVILHDGVISYLQAAHEGFKLSDPQPRNEAINNNLIRAQNIINELNASLDVDQGGDFAKEMQKIYDFFISTLIHINLNKTDNRLETDLIRIQDMVAELRDAWTQVANPIRAAESQAA
jgi:flagellar secretion chaperone FliS